MGLRSWIASAVRLIGTRDPGDFYQRAESARVVPSAELEVAEACLSGGGPIGARALRQLREALHVYRLREQDGSYELRVVSTAHFLIKGVPRSGWSTPSVTVESSSGQTLNIRLTIDPAGFVGLRGRTATGDRWPKHWHASHAAIESILSLAPLIDLPSPAEIRLARERARDLLREYLGAPEILRLRLFSVEADPPAAEHEIAALAATAGIDLPPAYADLLRRANGIEIGSLVVLGTRDAYRLDMPGPKRLVVSPPDEDGAFVVRESGTVEFVGIDSDDGTGRVVASDVQEWLLRAAQALG